VSGPKQSNSEIIAAYLEAVMRKDASVIDRFFAPDVEYMVNGTPVLDPDGGLPRSLRNGMRLFRGSASIEAARLSKNFWRTCTAIWRLLHLARVK
jgi:hypothetical protein